MELGVGPLNKRLGTQSRQGVEVDRTVASCHDLPKVRA